MIIFNKFNETVFYKKSTELEKQIQVLKNLHEKYPKNDKIARQLKLFELGIYGEKQIEYELKNANIGMYVLHDVNICSDDLKAQIDYIIITPAYTYFIECKNLIGNIIINDRGDFVREYSYNGQKYKEGIYSPLRQAEKHIDLFKKVWQTRHNTLYHNILNYKKKFDLWNKPLVVLSNSKNIIDVRKAPKDIKDKIVRSDYLVSLIKKDISKCSKDLLSTKNQMEKNAYTIMADYNRTVYKDYEAEFMKLVDFSENKIDKNEKIKQKLLEYRQNKSKQKNIPIYYIFTDEELEKILELMPKTKEQLESLNILPKIKLDLHGEEIIVIINNFV